MRVRTAAGNSRRSSRSSATAVHTDVEVFGSMLKRAQRAVLVATLLLVAFALHGLTCDWRVKAQVDRSSGLEPLLTWSHEPEWIKSGLFARRDSMNPMLSRGRSGAVVWGVGCPMLLVGLSAYLVLGWLHDSRVRRGFCPDCGYDLREGSGGRCPEYGSRA